AGPAARRAVGAAQAAFALLDDLNAQARPDDALAFGTALHVGEVAFGNIGGRTRMDFTCIGQAVNLAVRLEGLTSRLGRRLLLSEAISLLVGEGTRFVGSYPLKGLSEPARVYEPEG
ncbi:MAG: adenylate/guanylate cyclase domain-containing protein, partial [Myxococcales bacterium]|nr:adenylate/guanylate cyclase domain-containing protein [Myxococcales bacterium]